MPRERHLGRHGGGPSLDRFLPQTRPIPRIQSSDQPKIVPGDGQAQPLPYGFESSITPNYGNRPQSGENSREVTAAGYVGAGASHLFASLAQFERNLIRERTRAGLVSARARGRKGGRPPKLGPKEQREIRALLHDPEVTVSSVARRYGVSRVTLYAHLNAPAEGRE